MPISTEARLKKHVVSVDRDYRIRESLLIYAFTRGELVKVPNANGGNNPGGV